jgi:alpha-mannosidase
MRIVSAESTVFFNHDVNFPHRVDVTINNSGPNVAAAIMSVAANGLERKISLPLVPTGESTHEIYVPRIASRVSYRFQINNGEVQTVILDPQRHWDVSLIHMSHHDWGYTGIPGDVVAEHITFMDTVLDWCEETENWPEASKFRYLCEQAWSVVSWAENRPKTEIERLIRYIKRGQIEVTALWGNQTTELCSTEELARLMYPAFRLKREHGIDVVSAIHNDIPGLSWGLISLLANAGVKYLNLGIPRWYFTGVHPCWDEDAFVSMEIPQPFLWEGPDGGKLFTFYMLHAARTIPEPWLSAEADMDRELKDLAAKGYGYDQVAHMVTGGFRDNAPPTLYLAELARDWNRKWAYPKLKTATNGQFMGAFEEGHGLSGLPTVRGELPNTDYTACATCTPKETGVNRGAHESLATAEKLATVAAEIADYDYPEAVLEDAYRNTFNYDLHCWGMSQPGGPGMDASWDEKRGAATRAAALSHDVIVKAANRLTDKIAYPEESFYVTVFNSLGVDRDCTVRVPAAALSSSTMPMVQPRPGERRYGASAIGRYEVQLATKILKGGFDLLDVETGKAVSCQMSKISDPTDPRPWAAERVAISRTRDKFAWEVAFRAEGVPAMGYRSYRVVPRNGTPSVQDDALPAVESLENSFFRLRFDAATGDIVSLFDKEVGRELVDADAPHRFGDLIVRSCATAEVKTHMRADVHVVEHGAVFTTVRTKGESFAVPRWTRDVILYHSEKRIDVNFRLLRDSEPNVELFAAFPFLVPDPKIAFEASGSVIEPTVDQIPGSNTDYYAMQHWADIGGKGYGITWCPVDTHMVEFGGLWPGYVSRAHHGVTGPDYGHPFLKPGEIGRGHIYAMIMYSNYRTNFIIVPRVFFL